jgi:hypothetical protein
MMDIPWSPSDNKPHTLHGHSRTKSQNNQTPNLGFRNHGESYQNNYTFLDVTTTSFITDALQHHSDADLTRKRKCITVMKKKRKKS